MAKLDWDKINVEKRVQRHGSVGVFMAEMPLSGAEVVAGLVPKHLQKSMVAFFWSVIVADLNQSELPPIPYQLRRKLQRHLDRRGGVLSFAHWLLDVEAVKKDEKRKHESEKREQLAAIEKPLLHQAAKCELGLINPIDLTTFIPDHLKGRIKDRASLIKWAMSKPEYRGVRKNAENYAKHLAKKCL